MLIFVVCWTGITAVTMGDSLLVVCTYNGVLCVDCYYSYSDMIALAIEIIF